MTVANNVQEHIDERNTLLHELLDARARLAEVEAMHERLAAAVRRDGSQAAEQAQARQAAEARLAEVEAGRDEHRSERHRLMKLISVREADWEATKTRLAAVEALCDDFTGDIEHSRVHGDGPAEYREGWQHGVEFAAGQVRAAAAGDDRG
jgi:chromosome segregation ATPase